MRADGQSTANEEALERVVRRVVDDAAHATFDHDRDSHIARVRLVSSHVGGRSVGIRASLEWFDLTIIDLGVSVRVFEYDYSSEELDETLEALAEVAREYLIGGGEVRWRRGLLRSRPVLSVRTKHGEWRLGRRASSVPYP